MYANKDYLRNIPWYGVLGESDYRGKGLYDEFLYRNNNFKIENFLWAHTARIKSKSVAFVHIDTSFLAYGKEGESEKMKEYFK